MACYFVRSSDSQKWPSSFLVFGVLAELDLATFDDRPGWFGRAENQPRKRCSSDLLYAINNVPTPYCYFTEDRLEKSLEIKKYANIEHVAKSRKTAMIFQKCQNHCRFFIFYKLWVVKRAIALVSRSDSTKYRVRVAGRISN